MRGRVEQHGDSDVGNVVTRHAREPTVPCRTRNHAVGADHERKHIEVEVVTQEDEGHSAAANVLLGVPVVAREGERRLRTCAVEGQIHDALDAGRHGRVDGRRMQRDAIRVFGSRHKEERLDADQCGLHAGSVPVRCRRNLRPWHPRCSRGVTDDQPDGLTRCRQTSGNGTANHPGRAGYCDHAHLASSGRRPASSPGQAPSAQVSNV